MVSIKSHFAIVAEQTAVGIAPKPVDKDADEAAQKTLAAGAEATVKILQMAGWIQEMKAQLSRKEFGVFVKKLLQWVGDEARKYLDIARAFEGFDLSRLRCLEPFTIFKLRFARYAPVVARLREQSVVSPQGVQELISQLLPKPSRKKLDSNGSGWKQCRSGGGRYYNVLLHDEETGLSIEQQALNDRILPQRVIAEAVALRAQHKSVQVEQPHGRQGGEGTSPQLPSECCPSGSESQHAENPSLRCLTAQLEKLQTLVEQAISLDAENRKLAQELEKRDRKIAELEAKLAFKAVRQEKPEDEVALASDELSKYTEKQVKAIAPSQITSQQPETIEATDCSEPVGDDDFAVESVEKEENGSKLELEQNNVLKSDSGHKNLTEDKGASQARPNFVRYSRKLQPVEILTAAGEWVGGFFVHSCIAVANLVGTERRFTLFDADGVMYGFLGQIRPPQKIAGATKGAG